LCLGGSIFNQLAHVTLTCFSVDHPYNLAVASFRYCISLELEVIAEVTLANQVQACEQGVDGFFLGEPFVSSDEPACKSSVGWQLFHEQTVMEQEC
jgi:hypothetical protein